MSTSETAQKWADTLQNDLEAHADLYAADEEFSVETRMVDDHLGDTQSTRAELLAELAYWANQDKENGQGVHTLTITENYQGNGHEFLVWDYEISGLKTFHGLPVEPGTTLKSDGSTFLQYNSDGKIVLESTVVNQMPFYKAVGVPLITPHYWEADFDMAAFAASLGG